jgi:hypothetical protein
VDLLTGEEQKSSIAEEPISVDPIDPNVVIGRHDEIEAGLQSGKGDLVV